MKITAHIDSSKDNHLTTVSTNGMEKELTIGSGKDGYGSYANGAELLFLALATCYCNDIYREAKKRNINIRNVKVDVSGQFGGEGETGKNITYKVHIDSDASDQEIRDLILFTDEIAEIHNTLRAGAIVSLLLEK
ncbi:MAG: OsmC family protein [Saprospiraceae bacterium]|nr:OsmC family protein [Saprospiraceae bacterium]